jgi:hypothetical protein
MVPMSDKELNMYGRSTYYITKIKSIPFRERTIAKVE